MHRCYSLLLTIALTMPTHALASASTPWPVMPSITGQTGDLIHHLLAVVSASSVGGEVLLAPELVRDFYRTRNYRPAWVNEQGIRPDVQELIAVISRGDEEGLDAAFYHMNAVRERLATGSQDPVRMAELDLLITDAYLGYSRDISLGRTPLHLLAPKRQHVPETTLLLMLENSLAEQTVGESLNSMSPNRLGYDLLRRTLIDYRRIAEQGGWPILPPGQTLKIGMEGNRVEILRRRLEISADIASAGDHNPGLFDSTLKKGVQRFQERHGLAADGVVGNTTQAALNVPVEQRILQIELNMERRRGHPYDSTDRHIVVNMAGFELNVMEGEETVMDMRVIVGRDYRQTPVFIKPLTSVQFNPYWYVPKTIFREDFLPSLHKDPRYLDRMGIKIFSNPKKGVQRVASASIDWQNVDGNKFYYTLRQDPGPNNALGQVKFVLSNSDGIYLHDTPNRALFNKDVRTFSSGCIRVEDAVGLATYLLQDKPDWNLDSILNTIDNGASKKVSLNKPVPVHLVYWTSWVDRQGRVHFRNDIYGRDKRLAEALGYKDYSYISSSL